MNGIHIQLMIEATLIFTLIFLFNYIIFVRKNKKLKKEDMPLELIYLSNIYGIDPQKIKYRKFQYTYSVINSFIITATYLAVIYLVKTMIMKIIIGVTLMVLLIIICYGLLGRYYIYLEEKQAKSKKNHHN